MRSLFDNSYLLVSLENHKAIQMERKQTRPVYLPLLTNQNVLVRSFRKVNRCYLAWFVAILRYVMRKLKILFFKDQHTVLGMNLRVKFLCFVFVGLIFVTIMIMKFGPATSGQWKRSLDYEIMCLPKQQVYINGRFVCGNSLGVKYLSYQPPGGGWNNQRVAFENAVILAKLLNRTLIVHPLAPHQEILRLKRSRKMSAGYEIYNMLPADKLLPLSRVIDLKELSKLLPVKEVISSHQQFVKDYQHLTWRQVCHNSLVGIWVDAIPEKKDKEKWRLLRQYMDSNLPSPGELPLYRRICTKELKQFDNSSFRPVWGIWDELLDKTEEMLYFSEGSLYNRELLFFDKKTVLSIHDWTMRFVHFAPDIRKRVMAVLRTIGLPFSAIHVRRTDHPSSSGVGQEFWLKRLKVRDALNLTKTLYIATDEQNKTWFKPFTDEGYSLFFPEDFHAHLRFESENLAFVQDLLGLCEQLICAYADHFVGSYYSTFTMYIKRLRKQFSWKSRMLRKPYTTIVWIGATDNKT
ncbi:uncharacterized protein LOC111321237 [Stylophora pistillata]|uniref:uncharacterized protein LOC111321237 n=1 Tax=Stylophora pistillata TaxID=50429 RepID=UPI000C056A00|nr:uncharacterized protein LOC111321237 [Stylophora pistillata]